MVSPSEPVTIATVAAGGVVGATARWAIGTRLDLVDAASFPWHTLVVNVLGCLAIGVVAARLERNSLAWAFSATGVLGGFTTMSAFAVELNELADADRTGLVVTYLVSTLVGGAGALLAGEHLARSRAAGDRP